MVQSEADSCNSGISFLPLDHRPHTAREKSNQQVNFQALVNVGQINQSKTADTETVENYFSKAIAETEEAIEAQKEPLKVNSSPLSFSKYIADPSPRATSDIASAIP